MLDKMKIIFLNTWHSTMRDELYNYVKTHLSTTDIFCFQEAREEDRELYAGLFAKDFTLHAVKRTNPITDSEYGNALYVRSTIPVTASGAIFEYETGARDIGLASYVTLDIEGAKVTVCGIHGVPLPAHKLDTPARIYQSQTLIDTFEGQDAVVIGGDFNLLPSTKSVQLFEAHGYRNLIRDFEIPTTRNRIVFEKFPDNMQLYADYAFVSKSLSVKGFIVPEVIVSDHQPLELEVEPNAFRDALAASYEAQNKEELSL